MLRRIDLPDIKNKVIHHLGAGPRGVHRGCEALSRRIEVPLGRAPADDQFDDGEFDERHFDKWLGFDDACQHFQPLAPTASDTPWLDRPPPALPFHVALTSQAASLPPPTVR